MLWNICVINDHIYVHLVVSTSRSFPHSWLITGFVTSVTRRAPLLVQKLLTHPAVFSGVLCARCHVFLFFYIIDCPFFFFTFGHCVVFPSSICGFWLPLWYLLENILYEVCLIRIYEQVGEKRSSAGTHGMSNVLEKQVHQT